MNLLAPFFLIGLAAIALPIWLHRLQTQTPKRQRFSSSMLLEQAEQRVHVQKKLRYLVLLALRILLLALLALAFAKPIWERPPTIVAGPQPQLHLIVIDRSLSMAEGERIARARDAAAQIVDSMDNNDRAEVITADDGLEIAAGPLSGAVEGKTALNQAIGAVQAGAGQLDLGAMIRGLEGLIANETQPVVAHLIGDFQASGLPAQFGDLVPRLSNGRTLGVQLHPISEQDTANWSVESIKRTDAGADVVVRGLHTPEKDVTVSLLVNDAEKGKLTQKVSANGQASFSFANLALNKGENRVQATLSTGDSLTADDNFYAVIDNVDAQPIPLLTQNVKSVAVKYFTAAFAASDARFRIEPVVLGKFDARTLQRYPWVVIDDLGAVDANLAKELRNYVDSGGAILSALGERSLTLKQLPVTGQNVLAAQNTPDNGEPLSLGNINGSHPLLARTEGWRSTNFTRVMKVQTGGDDQILISLDDGTPVLLEHKLGKGMLLLLDSSLDNTWNDLPVQPVFVSFVAEAARYLSGGETLNRQQRIGSSLSSGGALGIGQIIDPQGKKLLSLAGAQRSETVKLAQPGFYQVYTQAGETLIAVNPDPRESDLAFMGNEALQRWRDALASAASPATSAGSTAQVNKAEPLELWHVLLALLALIVLAESLLGNRYVFRGVETPSRGLS